MIPLSAIEKSILQLPPVECDRLAEWLSSLTKTPRRIAESAVAYAGEMPCPMTLEEYLEFEEHSRTRHEYIAGEIFAMSGVTKRHNRIAGRLYVALTSHLKAGPCQQYMSDVKVEVRVNRDVCVYYPDLMVVCDPSEQEDRYVANPKLVIEVVSPSTEGVDRHEKRIAYRGIALLEEYVVIAQDAIEVTRFRREEGWRPTVLRRIADALELRSIGLTVPLAQVYEGEQV